MADLTGMAEDHWTVVQGVLAECSGAGMGEAEGNPLHKACTVCGTLMGITFDGSKHVCPKGHQKGWEWKWGLTLVVDVAALGGRVTVDALDAAMPFAGKPASLEAGAQWNGQKFVGSTGKWTLKKVKGRLILKKFEGESGKKRKAQET
ncbi:hypothetical protein DIPPA_22475 [Diplonema papillatum]|nr:hypothetical protein DIPPA_22475 [Diplonema papillatum]